MGIIGFIGEKVVEKTAETIAEGVTYVGLSKAVKRGEKKNTKKKMAVIQNNQLYFINTHHKGIIEKKIDSLQKFEYEVKDENQKIKYKINGHTLVNGLICKLECEIKNDKKKKIAEIHGVRHVHRIVNRGVEYEYQIVVDEKEYAVIKTLKNKMKNDYEVTGADFTIENNVMNTELFVKRGIEQLAHIQTGAIISDERYILDFADKSNELLAVLITCIACLGFR